MASFVIKVQDFTPVLDKLVDEMGIMSAMIYGVVWRYSEGQEGICRASIAEIAHKAGVQQETALQHIERLCKAGHLVNLTPKGEKKLRTIADMGRISLEGLVEMHISTKDPGPETEQADPELVKAMMSVGFRPEHEARQYAMHHPRERILGWVRFLRARAGSEALDIKNPGGYLRDMLDAGEDVKPHHVLLQDQPRHSSKNSETSGSEDVETILAEMESLPPQKLAARRLWDVVKEYFRLSMTRSVHDRWFRLTEGAWLENNVLWIQVASEDMREGLKERLLKQIVSAVETTAGEPIEVCLMLEGEIKF